jgi:hypothetical protein
VKYSQSRLFSESEISFNVQEFFWIRLSKHLSVVKSNCQHAARKIPNRQTVCVWVTYTQRVVRIEQVGAGILHNLRMPLRAKEQQRVRVFCFERPTAPHRQVRAGEPPRYHEIEVARRPVQQFRVNLRLSGKSRHIEHLSQNVHVAAQLGEPHVVTSKQNERPVHALKLRERTRCSDVGDTDAPRE